MMMMKGELYKTLGLSPEADAAAVKAAYRKLALKYHPDRNNGNDDACKHFQEIGRAYSVLGDAKLRAIYDRTGQVPEDGPAGRSQADWLDYFRSMYEQVSMQALDDFRRQYRESAEELEDVLAAYMRHKGNLLAVVDDVFFAGIDDIERFNHIISRAISKSIVPSHPAFEKGVDPKALARHRSRAAKEAKQAAKTQNTMKEGSADDLAKAILARANRRTFDDIADDLAAKYGKPTKKTRK